MQVFKGLLSMFERGEEKRREGVGIYRPLEECKDDQIFLWEWKVQLVLV